MATITDDLGHTMQMSGPRDRVVCLVPSLTEAIASVRPDALVGATDWCTHPADLQTTRVRGTKNPDLAKIRALHPNLVIANREENRRVDVERMRVAGLVVWVTVVESVPQALASLRRMFQSALGWDVPAWLEMADAVWDAPTPPGGPRVVIPIWRDPWMVVGSRTFAGDVITRVGAVNTYADARDRYPRVDLEEITARRADVVVLPDEPYRFTDIDGPESFPETRCVPVEGRALTWYGPSLVNARAQLAAALLP